MFQHATPLRKSSPWTPNISDEHVSCTAPAMRCASWQILFKCPTPANVFGNATKLSRFAHFWQGAEPLAPAKQNHIILTSNIEHFWLWNVLRHNGVHFFNITTSKSGPTLSVFNTLDFEMCFAPQRHALFQHHNFQKWSEPVNFFALLTLKCASCHNGVHFFDISIPKSAPKCASYILASTCASDHNGV